MNEETKKELEKELKISDIEQKTARELAKLIGMDNLLKLADYCNGDSVYIPTTEKIVIKARNRAIKKDKVIYNYTTKEIAKKWGMKPETVRKILRESN